MSDRSSSFEEIHVLRNMNSGGSNYQVPVFDGKMDFTVWQMTIQDVLVQQGLDEALEENKPDGMKDVDWAKIQKRASSTIRLALAPEIKFSVLKETTPRGIWEKLASIYASKSLTNRLFLKMDLYCLKFDEGGNLHDHINSFSQLVCRLSNVDETIKDEEQALLLLASLPKSYKPFVQTMLTGRTTLTLDDVVKALRDNERMTRSDSFSNGDRVLVAEGSERGRNYNRGGSKGRGRSQSRGDRDMSKIECFYCGETGHMQMRCPQFREDLKSLHSVKEKKKVDEEKVNTIDSDDGDFLLTETVAAANVIEEKKSEWVLDSAASVHICKDQAMFDTLRTEGNFGDIKVGNEQKLKIEGVGSVRFKLHDGTVKTALNVKYVPGATANLLSLGVLTSRGYRYVGRRQTCKVYKGKRLILQGRKGARNICYLEGQSFCGRSFCDDKKEKKIGKRVRFSGVDEILGIFGQGEIC